MKCAVVGAGAWGTALASVLADNGHETMIWTYEPDVAAAIKNFRKGLQDADDKTPASQLKADPATADPMQTDPAAKATADSKRENTPQG